MSADAGPSAARLGRLAEELAESGLELEGAADWRRLVLGEIDYALRPHVHERKAASNGALIEPRADPAQWAKGTLLQVTRRPIGQMPLIGARRFADGMSSWLIRRLSGDDEWAVFDRPAGSERDLVVLAAALAATIVQRHPTGTVRVVGTFGVARWEGLMWHHEAPIWTWIGAVAACVPPARRAVLRMLLEFAVHDLGSRGIGATLVYRPDDDTGPAVEARLALPPPLDISRPADLAPLRHALAQVDGAAVLDASGVLRQLGVRLLPSADAVTMVAGYRGMRHTSARRYSYDDPSATVVVVSEDGPVTVLRNGELVGASRTLPPEMDIR